MGDRSMGWYSINSTKTNGEHKKQKVKPANLNLTEPKVILEKRRHTIHGYQDNVSPPYSPNSSLSGESSGTYSPEGSSPRAFARDWQQQPKRRSLTPIPEKQKQNGHNDIIIEEGPDFLRELSTPTCNINDIKVIVGRNKIRIIGESNDTKNGCKPQEFHKFIDIPQHIDPLSIKVKKYTGKIIIHGYLDNSKKSWKSAKNNFLSPENHNSVSLTVNIPPGYNTKHLRFKTVTKHYLIVSGADEGKDKDLNEDFLETFELPAEPDKFHISSDLIDNKTLLVEVPLVLRSRLNSM